MEKFDEQKNYTTNDLARMIFLLSGSFIGMENSQAKLENSFARLEDSQAKLESSFSRLEDSQTKLENSQTKLENSFIKLEGSFSKLENSFKRLEDSQTKLENSFSGLEGKFDRLYEYTVNGFRHMDEKIDFVHSDFKEELDFKFNGLNLRLDDLANTKADKTDLNKIATRVEALETLAVNSQK